MERRDISILFSTRIIRLFAYGFLSVILAFYLAESGLNERSIGLLFSFTLVGDAGISLWLTTSADRLGRRRMLRLGAGLMVLAGVAFLVTRDPILLTLAAIIGVISPSGNEIGPFLSIEQAALTQLIEDNRRTQTFAWYNLSGSFATASGALVGGWLAKLLQSNGWSALESYRVILAGYAAAGILLLVLFFLLSSSVEAAQDTKVPSRMLGLHRSRRIVVRLSALFAMDAFAGGLIIQSMLAYWFHMRFGVDEGILGSLFFGANILAGVSALLAARIAARIGLIKTMVYTHIPSSLLLMLVPLMPGFELAVVILLARYTISQMDVPTRQSYTLAVVAPDERSAASGVTTIARSIGAALSPSLSGVLFSIPGLVSLPFFLCGSLKIAYDLILYWSFKSLKPPEEETT